MSSPSATRVLLVSAATFLISFVTGISIIGSIEFARIQSDERKAAAHEVYFGLNSSYDAYMLVRSFDMASGTMRATIRSNMTNQDIDTLLYVTDNFSVMRRDVTFEDGVLVGFGKLRDSSPSAVLPGTKGVGKIKESGGRFYLSSFIFGIPFARP